MMNDEKSSEEISLWAMYQAEGVLQISDDRPSLMV